MDEEDVGFTTASDLREEASEPAGPDFSVDHPERTHQRSGGMRYEGGTVFVLAADGDLAAAVEAVLADGPYRYGDWFDLPMPLYLVHDDDTDDTFRVAVRDGTVELHPRSATGPEGLRAFYERLADRVGRVEVDRKR
ncbi:hypothetical protein [Halosegnis marinus]|uniref:Uncharacterized protein n=1 Tax=Halosegnis marinus TaxID=3034023 RepID=A0ABD5ZLL0_9EURY|nr:hypothetical protein [Halosegnis sp. DT85]